MVSLVSGYAKKKNKGRKEERKRLEVASISIEPWMEKRGLTDGWNFFVQFILYFAYRESTIELWSCKVVVEEEDNAVANYSDDSFRFLVP